MIIAKQRILVCWRIFGPHKEIVCTKHKGLHINFRLLILTHIRYQILPRISLRNIWFDHVFVDVNKLCKKYFVCCEPTTLQTLLSCRSIILIWTNHCFQYISTFLGHSIAGVIYVMLGVHVSIVLNKFLCVFPLVKQSTRNHIE